MKTTTLVAFYILESWEHYDTDSLAYKCCTAVECLIVAFLLFHTLAKFAITRCETWVLEKLGTIKKSQKLAWGDITSEEATAAAFKYKPGCWKVTGKNRHAFYPVVASVTCLLALLVKLAGYPTFFSYARCGPDQFTRYLTCWV